MDGSFARNLPGRGLFWLAAIGLASMGIVGCSAIGFLVWFLVNHVRII